jgi:ABC-type transport system involved in cytochrome c biogenesis permease component
VIKWLRTVMLLCAKEARVEWRGREFVTLLVCNSVIIAVLVGVGVSSAILDGRGTTRIFPMLLWLVFLLSATTSVARSSESELEGRGFEGLLLAGVTGSQMYVAKVVVVTALFWLNFCVLAALLAAILNQEIWGALGDFIALGGVASFSLAGLVTLLSGIAGTSRLRGVLVPILSLPLLFPVFFAGVEMTADLVTLGALRQGSVWPVILVAAGSLYGLVGLNLFESAIRD